MEKEEGKEDEEQKAKGHRPQLCVAVLRLILMSQSVRVRLGACSGERKEEGRTSNTARSKLSLVSGCTRKNGVLVASRGDLPRLDAEAAAHRALSS